MEQLRNENLMGLFLAVDSWVDQNFEKWKGWRRHLHRFPELSWQETETTRFIEGRLKDAGLLLRPGPRGLGGLVDLGFGDRNHVIACRGDIDAIPVTEETAADYASQHAGVMHACGHDVHTTVMLAVCETLHSAIGPDSGLPAFSFRGIFQPAEEVAEGAVGMIDSGGLENVKQIIAMHVDPSRQVGYVGLRDGVQTACCDEIEVHFEGPGGHGARPHETSDTIFAASQFINAAYAGVPRMNDPRQSMVLSFCQIEGGRSANVIPTSVKLRGTLRSYSSECRQKVFQQLQLLSETVGQSLGVKVNFVNGNHVPSVVNCPKTNQLVRDAADTFLMPDAVDKVDLSLGGEDFAGYLTKVPGSLVRVGSANGDFGTAWLHSPHFDVDERVISVAVRLFARTVLFWASRRKDMPVEPPSQSEVDL